MKVGDMVVHAYAFRAFIPGIIVDQHIYTVEPDPDEMQFDPYEEHSFIVQWSDGSQSSEMSVELDDLENTLEFEVKRESW